MNIAKDNKSASLMISKINTFYSSQIHEWCSNERGSSRGCYGYGFVTICYQQWRRQTSLNQWEFRNIYKFWTQLTWTNRIERFFEISTTVCSFFPCTYSYISYFLIFKVELIHYLILLYNCLFYYVKFNYIKIIKLIC